MECREVPAPEAVSSMNDDRFAAEAAAVLIDAKAMLTEEEILAVVTMRRERALMSALEDLILGGECGATLETPQGGPFSSVDFAFYAFSAEERAERTPPTECHSCSWCS